MSLFHLQFDWPIFAALCHLKKYGAANVSKPVGPEQYYFITSIQHKHIKNRLYLS